MGAELFGHAGLDSDVEIITLLLETLRRSSVPEPVLDLGHVGIFRALSQAAHFTPAQERAFYAMLERKSLPEIDQWLQQTQLPADIQTYLRQLPRLHGDASVLQTAREAFANADPIIQEHLNYLQTLVERITQTFPECRVHIDLAELSGYDYHTGIVYAVYLAGFGREIARGGRYDGIGEAFGRVRPATGFSTDLRTLARFAYTTIALPQNDVIFAPAVSDPTLEDYIRTLRNQGSCVVRELAGLEQTPHTLGCTHTLVQEADGQWSLNTL